MASRAVAGRYTLLREVGQGGMAIVWLAVDEKHQREVALKALRPELAAAVGSDRFLREIEITAGLNHPHILPLLDSGAEDWLLYYVMPYVAGGSLRLLVSGDPLPLAAVTRIAREVAAALDHAHARSVVHRDIKPENILFNEGLAVVSDFGIARAVQSAGSRRMTATGLSIGTLGYMSPEQALGTAELDARSDVYSLGSVVYEMLVGETPAAWPGAEDVELGRFAEIPDAHRRRLDDCPGRVQQVLVKALALRPQHRYETAGEMAAALTAASERTTRFSDDEVRRLLARAAELQAEAPEPAPGELTMGHVEQIAAEVGIPPAHVREAVRELDRGRPEESGESGESGESERPEGSSRAGSPTTRRPGEPAISSSRVAARMDRDWGALREGKKQIVVDESVEGEVPEAALPAMVAEINRSLGILGHASAVGGTLTWTPAEPSEDTRRILVHVAGEGGRTRIRIREELVLSGAQKFIPPVVGLFGAGFGGAFNELLFAGGEPGSGLLILVFGGLGLFLGKRSAMSAQATERRPKLKRLGEALAGIARAAIPGPPPGPSGSPERPELPDSPGPPESPDAEPRSR